MREKHSGIRIPACLTWTLVPRRYRRGIVPKPRELPIPFSTPLVRAILNTQPGVWPAEPIDPAKPFKWQTRRLVRTQPAYPESYQGYRVEMVGNCARWFLPGATEPANLWHSPYHPGDVLRVNEALRPSGSRIVVYDQDRCPAWRDGESVTWPWKVSALAARYMPRWAARRWLEVKRVRVERLEQISEEDARAEGLALTPCTHPDCGPGTRCGSDSYRGEFAVTWNKLHEDHPWGSGVWVFAYDFMVLSSPKGVTD